MNAPPPRIDRIGSDPDAFEAFYREHVAAVTRYVARRVDDPQVAADLTADIFLAVIEHADGYRPDRGPVIAWVYGVARNVIANHQRRRTRELRAVSRIRGRALLDADSLARMEERIDAERELRRVYRALGELSPRDRRLFELVAVDGLSVTEAATALGVKPGTARVRLHRCRARLNRHLSTPLTGELPTQEVTS